MLSSNNAEILELLRKHTREELVKELAITEENLERTVTAFLHENLRGLRRSMGSVKFEKQLIKQMKRTGTLAMCRLDNNTVLEKGLYYYQGNDFASELVYSDVSVNLVSNISTITSSHWIPFRKVSSLTLRKILST